MYRPTAPGDVKYDLSAGWISWLGLNTGRDALSQRVVSRLRTPEAYAFTARSAAAIAERVLRGDWEAGFQTPSRVYGPDFVLSFDGVEREDLPQPGRWDAPAPPLV